MTLESTASVRNDHLIKLPAVGACPYRLCPPDVAKGGTLLSHGRGRDHPVSRVGLERMTGVADAIIEDRRTDVPL